MPLLRRRHTPTAHSSRSRKGSLPLKAGDRVAVIGGGPAGCFFAHQLLHINSKIRRPLQVDIFDPRGFGAPGPRGCAHCGGIVSESLVQILAADGLRLPPEIVQRGIGSYVVHMDVGAVRIQSAREEERIAALYRGGGPRGSPPTHSQGLDDFLLKRALEDGARHVSRLVDQVVMEDGLPWITHPDGTRSGPYHLVAVASGVNSQLVPILQERRAPELMRTYICEFRGTEEQVQERLGNAMHVFLLDLPRLEFAALIPKGPHVTLCMLGEGIDKELVDRFISTPEVKSCLDGLESAQVCQCSPVLNLKSRTHPFGERIVFIGDAGVTRLYKDGIGAAYRTATAAAQTAALFGVSEKDFRKHYRPICRSIESDNRIGRAIFAGTVFFKKLRFLRQGVLHMVRQEQKRPGVRRMSSILWNLFTGSAPYKAIIAGAMRPEFLGSMGRSLIVANTVASREV